MRLMSVENRDAFANAIDKVRALRMALHGADSLMDRGEADALLLLCYDALREFESIQSAIEGAPVARAA